MCVLKILCHNKITSSILSAQCYKKIYKLCVTKKYTSFVGSDKF
jgi:hypothetical protein